MTNISVDFCADLKNQADIHVEGAEPIFVSTLRHYWFCDSKGIQSVIKQCLSSLLNFPGDLWGHCPSQINLAEPCLTC